jgi:ribosomal protein L37AE/L43A
MAMTHTIECDACGSDDTTEMKGAVGVFVCNTCGEIFEDDALPRFIARKARPHFDDDER